MRTISVRIEGIAPLLQHRFPSEKPEEKAKRKTATHDWKAEAESALYRTEEGNVYQPAIHLEQAMIKAATNFQIPGRRQKTYKDIVASAVVVSPEFIPHIRQQFEIDERPVRIQRARIIRYRPRFDKWALAFEIQVIDEQLDISVVRDILDHAGKYVGIGDYRPRYGRFQVVEWNENGKSK